LAIHGIFCNAGIIFVMASVRSKIRGLIEDCSSERKLVRIEVMSFDEGGGGTKDKGGTWVLGRWPVTEAYDGRRLLSIEGAGSAGSTVVGGMVVTDGLSDGKSFLDVIEGGAGTVLEIGAAMFL